MISGKEILPAAHHPFPEDGSDHGLQRQKEVSLNASFWHYESRLEMSVPLQILIVDDSDDDAFLIVRAIERAGYKVDFRRVQNAVSMTAALEAQKWDLILGDYSMPQFTGLEALTIWKQRELDIPFIMVSGVIDDEKAVAAMKAGARDYIRKSALKQLAPAIERELREAAERRLLTRRYRAFSRLGQSLSSATSPQDAARIISGVADELIGWDSCFVDLYAPTLDKFYHVFDVDIVDGVRQELPPEDWGTKLTPLLERVLNSGPVLILRDKADFGTGELRPFGDKARPSASLMIVPIRNGTQVLGFLSIQSYTHFKYKQEDLSTLQTLADYCAGALERIRTEEELRASEKRYRILFDNNPSPVFVFDRNTLEILAVNEAAIRLYGYSRKEFLSMTIKDIRPPEDVAPLLGRMDKIKSEEKRLSVGRHQKKDGTIIDVEVTSSPLMFAERQARLSLVMDVTERKKLEKEILEISGREQRRIGHDLHDGLCQHLAGISFLSQILSEKLAEKSAPESTESQKITSLIEEAVNKSRSLARGLFPVRLEENGLSSALEELAANTEDLFKIQCHFQSDETALSQDAVRAENLYYIAHEALMNAIKHGKARTVWLRLETKNERIILTVKDDGIGIPDQPAQPGMGLRIMSYRARMIGASIEVKRDAGGGTLVSCSFPQPVLARKARASA